MFFLFLSIALAADLDSAPSPADLQAALTAALALGHPVDVALDAHDCERLAQGEVVKRLVGADKAPRVTGAIWVKAPPEALWIAVQDNAHRAVLPEGAVLTRLPGDSQKRRLNYNQMPLPWPMADRQWVSEVVPDAALYEASGHRVWARTWDLLPPSLAPSPDPEAVWMEANEGGWMFVEADGGTLAVIDIRTDAGGALPASLTTRWGLGTIEGSLHRLERHASTMAVHYDAAHERYLDPSGTVIDAIGRR